MNSKADRSTTYTKTATDTKLNVNTNKTDTYTKTEFISALKSCEPAFTVAAPLNKITNLALSQTRLSIDPTQTTFFSFLLASSSVETYDMNVSRNATVEGNLLVNGAVKHIISRYN